ncbi:MAG: hypothetical protein ABIO70_14350 [Pseudomonadota bacterium]
MPRAPRAPCAPSALGARGALVALLLAGACTPPARPGFGPSTDVVEDTGWDGSYDDPTAWLRDHWSATAERCQPPDPFENGWMGDGAFETDFCQDWMIADLNIDLSSFGSATFGDDELWYLLAGTYVLLGTDLGDLETLSALDTEDGYYIREPLIEQLLLAADTLGEERLRAVTYDMVMSTILHTKSYESEHAVASFVFSTRTLRWDGLAASPQAAAALVHEAAHGWQHVGHVQCPEGHVYGGYDYSGVRECDEDWAGAWGFEAGVARLMYKGALGVNEVIVEDMEMMMDQATFMILED